MSSSASETIETPISSNGISNFKSLCIVIVVIGCFAVLWPKIFYPMLLYGLRWDSRQSSENAAANNYMLPPKVLEAMRQSPNKNTQPQKLPGRPQFYTGKREILTGVGGSQNSVWNVFVPLYALILIVIFMYALFKLSLKSDDYDQSTTTTKGSHQKKSLWSSLHDPKECRECQYDLLRHEYTYKRYDPFMSRSSYRTFDYYGRRNVSRIMHSLVEDVKTFRDNLIRTEKCSCKLADCEKDGDQAKSSLETDKQINDQQIKQNENDNEEEQQKQQDSKVSKEENSMTENHCIYNMKNINVTAQQDHSDDDDDDEQIDHAMAEDCHENNDKNRNEDEKENEENIIKKTNAVEILNNKHYRMMRKRIIDNFRTKIFKDKCNDELNDFEQQSKSSSSKLVRRINHKLEKFMHLKKK
uniref:Resistance to inhibitors of cholinesterase protein 3-like isoform X1 n=1 Tax=Dermatophagoides pteronyssinus TaxID=6956 RepID=A0A6P6YDW4_DERPT|nr:resistance to inhibitors of cholinesterase protein 3-like isoform X1 [Dermatophagoides pteronyssinus]